MEMCWCVCVGRGDAAGSHCRVYRAANAVSGRISGEARDSELPTHALTTLHTQQRTCGSSYQCSFSITEKTVIAGIIF